MSTLALIAPAGICAVKLALRLNDPTPPDIADAMDDLTSLFALFGDEFQRRKLSRQTQDIADEIARRIAREIEVEYPRLSESDLAAAIEDVVAAVNSVVPLDARTRVEIVTSTEQPLALFALVSRKAGIDKWEKMHGEVIASLSRTLLREVCHATVAIIRKHPELSIDMLVALTQRVEDYARVVQDIAIALEAIPERLAVTPRSSNNEEAGRADRDYTVEYLRAVADEFDRIGLYGLDLDWNVVNYSLTTSYVSLRTVGGGKRRDATLDHALSAPGIVYLRGPAGSGKTTILQWLAVGAARRSLPTDYHSIRDHIPLFVRLRDYAEGQLPDIRQLGRLTIDGGLLAEPENWMDRIGEERGFILLVDGIDEYPETRKRELVDWLRTARNALGAETKIVVTGRPTAETTAASLLASSLKPTILDIQPMDREEIRSFVLHWHKSVNQRGRERPVALDALAVADLLSGSRDYRLLSTTPLLCAALCALFYVKNGMPPTSRIQIYDTLLRLLLAERETQRRITVDQISLDADQKELILQQLAMFMLSNNLSEVESDRAEASIERSLAFIPGQHDAQAIFRWLLRRSGVIREPSPGQVDFVHRSLLEYLAAAAHVAMDSVESLGKHADDPNWSDAVILAGSLANVKQLSRLVAMLIDMEGVGERPPAWLTGVAAGILQTRPTRVPEIAQDLEQLLQRSLPPRSEEQVRAILSIGEPLIPLLISSLFAEDGNPNANVSPSIIGATIRALGEHGGDVAFAEIANLSGIVRLEFIDDLLAIWPWFGLEEFAARVLSDLEPADPTAGKVRTSRAFPFLSRLSNNFVWDANIGYPEPSLVLDCQDAPLRSLTVGHLDVLDDDAARSGQFLRNLRGPESVMVRNAPSLSTHQIGRDASRLRTLSVDLAGGEFALSTVRNATGLEKIDVSGFGTITEGPSYGDVVGSAEKADPILSVAGQISADGIIGVRVAQLESVPGALVGAVASPQLEVLVLKNILDLNLDYLENATSLREIHVLMCTVHDVSALIDLGNLALIELRGANHIAEENQLQALHDKVPNLILDPALAALLGTKPALRN